MAVANGTFPTHKEDSQITSCEHRVAMARLAVEDLQECGKPTAEDIRKAAELPLNERRKLLKLSANKVQRVFGPPTENASKISVSTLETESGERSYTCRTLQKIRRQRPCDEIFFIVGADSLAYMDHWVHPEIIFQNAIILAAGRDAWHEEQIEEKIHQLKELYSADIRMVHCQNLPIASREIRGRIAAGEDVSEWIPESVDAYIRAHGLYQSHYNDLQSMH